MNHIPLQNRLFQDTRGRITREQAAARLGVSAGDVILMIADGRLREDASGVLVFDVQRQQAKAGGA